MTERVEVVVIGAGFAGLRAARDCADAGVPTVVVEARDRLGGRTWTRPYGPTGEPVELGGAYFLHTHGEVTAELHRYGLGARRCAPPGGFRWHTAGMTRTGLPVPVEEWPELERVLRAVARDVDDYAAGAAPEVAALSLAEYFDRLATPQAVRDFLFGWSVTSIGAPESSGCVADGLSSLADHGGFLGYARILEQVPVPGWGALAAAMAATPDVEVRLAEPVTGIAARGSRFRVTTAHGDLDASRVVMAVPVNILPHLTLELDVPSGITAVAGANTGAAVKLVLRAAGVPAGVWGVGRGCGLGQLVWDRQDDGVAWLVGFGARDPAVDLDRPEQVRSAVASYFPEATVLDSTWHDWNADVWSRGTWFTARPGRPPAPAPAGDPHAAVQFAGSDLAGRHQGWIEGALVSGAQAAARILHQLGVADLPTAAPPLGG